MRGSIYLEAFLQALRVERFASKNTIQSYKADIVCFMLFCTKELHLITYTEIEDYMLYMKSLGRGALTLARRLSAIKQYFAFLVLEGVIEESPVENISHPKLQRSLPKPLSESLIDKMFSTLEKLPQSKINIRNMLILDLLYATGIRVSELISIKLKDLAFDAEGNVLDYIIIRGKRNKERMVMIHERSCNLLKTYISHFLSEQDEWLFPSASKDDVSKQHITRQRCNQILGDIAQMANIPKDVISPHKLRHSFATNMLQNGAGIRLVQELLGHSGLASTQIYTKVNNKAFVKALDKHPLNDG